MSTNLDTFIAANRRSAVVTGSVIGRGGQGAHYTLGNGLTFTLTADECRQTDVRWQGVSPVSTDGRETVRA
jgi:hypothetical protein